MGPVSIGSDLTAATAVMSHFTAVPSEKCPNPRLRVFEADDAPTIYFVLDESGRTVQGLRAIDTEATLGAGRGPRTSEGIGIGSSFSEVTAAYPGAVVDSSTGVVDYSLTSDTEPWISFGSSVDQDQSFVRDVDVFPGGPLFYELCGG